MESKNRLFDIVSTESFYNSIDIAIDQYKLSKEKSAASLLFIILGLNHLREWIAPGYSSKEDKRTKIKKTPRTLGEYFYERIWREKSFKIINELCNTSKHQDSNQYHVFKTEAIHNDCFDEYEDIDTVLDFDKGPVMKYLVNDKDIIFLMEEVLNFYKNEWFCNKDKQKLKTFYENNIAKHKP